MSYARKRISARQYLSRTKLRSNTLRTYQRRRFVRPSPRLPVYNRATRYVRRPLGNPLAVTERKYHDVERGGTLIVQPNPDWSVCIMDPMSGIYSFNAIPVGTSWQQRIGRKVQLVSLKLKGEIGIQAQSLTASPMVAQTIRVLIYLDMQTNGIVPSNPGEVLFSGPSSAVPISYFQNGSSFGRFKILRDIRFVLNPINTVYDYSNNVQHNNSYVKIIDQQINFNPPLVVHFNGANTGTNADIIDNSIHMAVAKDNAGFPDCFLSYKARVTFFDC